MHAGKQTREMSAAVKPWELSSAYAEGRNLMALLRDRGGVAENTEDIIELSYDLQSGSYIRALAKGGNTEIKLRFTERLVEVIESLGTVHSLLDAGMGEGTTLWGLISQMKAPPKRVAGFDLCWSRVATGRRWLKEKLPDFEWTGVTGSLAEIPCADASFDVVYTCHALEPNRGREAELLSELFRVARRAVVLLEPAYEFANEEARRRMDSLGYCRQLAETARRLGLPLTRHEMFASNGNDLNPTALLVLDKGGETGTDADTHPWVCPAYRTPLLALEDCWFSRESMRAYPVIGGIPCLRSCHGIVASKRLPD